MTTTPQTTEHADLMRLVSTIEQTAVLLGVNDAKKGHGIFTAADGRFQHHCHDSIYKAKTALSTAISALIKRAKDAERLLAETKAQLAKLSINKTINRLGQDEEGYLVVKNTELEQMVSRFLGWKLPEDFAPDCQIIFDKDRASQPPHSWPIGTNLLDARQAKAMLEEVTAPLQAKVAALQAEVERLTKNRDRAVKAQNDNAEFNDQLQARLNAMEGQEPVACIYNGNQYMRHEFMNDKIPEGSTPLYLASGAAPKTRPTTREEKIVNPGVYVTAKKPAACENGCPDMQVCDYCQGTGGDDAQAAPKEWNDENVIAYCVERGVQAAQAAPKEKQA